MVLKLIFLDFDGVLNSSNYFEEWVKQNEGRRGGLIDQLDPAMVERLNKIVEATKSLIVISSTWRILHTIGELKEILTSFGFKYSDRIIARTPQSFSGHRGREISIWLEEDQSQLTDNFIILDDGSDMEPFMDHLIQTSWDKGMQDNHVEEAIRRLNGV